MNCNQLQEDNKMCLIAKFLWDYPVLDEGKARCLYKTVELFRFLFAATHLNK